MNDVRLHIRHDDGTGNPIVLLHGLFGDGTQWEKVVELLKPSYRVITLDLLGHGQSPKHSSFSYTETEQVTALNNALESIGVKENITIVGYSMGGSVALSYSAHFQNKVDQLYLISSPFYLKPEQMIAANYASSLLLTKTTETIFKKTEGLLEANKLTSKVVDYANSSDIFRNMIGARENKVDTDVAAKSIKNLVREFDFAGNLAKVKCPVSFYVGKKDTFIVQGQLYALKNFCPHMDIQRLDIIKIDHMLVQNLPKEISSLILKNNATKLFVTYDRGNGNPVVLLHGIESSSVYWENIVKYLAQNRRVITVDLLGFGQSPKPTNIAYSLDDQVKWLDATLKELSLSTFDICGHSLGGLVALAYTNKFPDKIKSITLFSPVLKLNDKSTKYLIKSLGLFDKATNSKVLNYQVIGAVGTRRINKLLPTIRSIKNAVNKQSFDDFSKKLLDIPITIAYGRKDPLVDPNFINNFAAKFAKHEIIALPNRYHNFAMFEPARTLQILGTEAVDHKINKPSKLPVNFYKQVFNLAGPVLFVKGLFLLLFGILLFSDYAAATLSIGLSYLIINKGYKIIKGSFSLKNEGLSYFGYLLLGIISALIGYGLVKYPELSLKIAVILICGMILLTGLVRLIAALLWTSKSNLKKSLVLSGTLMTVIGLAAFGGNLVSMYLIIYAVAFLLIVQGLQLVFYSGVLTIMAFVRGFNKYIY